MNDNQWIDKRFQQVMQQIEDAARHAGRQTADIKVVVVTKNHPLPVVQAVVAAGARYLGENRVEEAVEKIQTWKSDQDIEWHMIGHVQSRKAAQVCQHFDQLHSLDRLKLAQRLEQHAAQMGRILPLLLQFNVSGEESKSGWPAADQASWPQLLPEIDAVLGYPHLKVCGLMTMAPYNLEPEASRPIFVKLRRLRDQLALHFPQADWNELSMGMSQDYLVAVQEGATFLRIGTAILGT